MPPVLLTKRIEFAAAHRYYKPEWDEAKNRSVFGRCYNPPAHGHNYLLEVTVSGDVDPKTGMVINLFDLKRVLLAVIEEFDHKHLNLDMPYFAERIPTSENLARVLWTKLVEHKDIGELHAIRLYEDEDLYADVTRAGGLDRASVTRRYSFVTVQEGNQGREWDCFVTVQGTIDPVTGMVTDLGLLNRRVQDLVVSRFHHQDLRQVLGSAVPTGEELVRRIWEALASHIGQGRLSQIHLVHSRDLAFDYCG
ncbi:MAG TPA: 6-carboxytetrahydropterin synthase [Nitrospira sp.]|nr:6-carboxytetrahydropterin synthase [Nitrospira sp.]